MIFFKHINKTINQDYHFKWLGIYFQRTTNNRKETSIIACLLFILHDLSTKYKKYLCYLKTTQKFYLLKCARINFLHIFIEIFISFCDKNQIYNIEY